MDLRNTHFFTVELRNGHVMSTPRYEPAQEFFGNLVHDISLKEPEFAWVQFVFRNLDYHSHLVTMKGDLSYYKRFADTPGRKTDSEGKEYTVDRKEKGTEWYRSVQEKTKKIDEIKPLPTITMAIRGMWVGELEALVGLNAFSNCNDELDRLVVVPLHDPRMLVWLVKRRMLANPAEYVLGYGTAARRASPELILTTEDLPYYVHLPAGKKMIASLKETLRFGASSTAKKEMVRDEGVPIFRGNEGVEKEEEARPDGNPIVASMAEVAELDEPLKDEEAANLRHVSSNVVRSFEVVYDRSDEKPGRLLLSSRTTPDLVRFEEQLNAVYSRMDYVGEDLIPPYLRSLASAIASPNT